MSVMELRSRRDARPAAAPSRRIRDHARDQLSAAALSLTGSVAATVVVWLVLWWLA